MNKVTIMGRFAADPETKAVNDTSVTKMFVAVNKTWKDQNGEKKEKTAFLNANAWGRQGEVIAQYHKKGDPIILHGELESREWETEEGQKRKAVEIRVNGFDFIPTRKGVAQTEAQTAQTTSDTPQFDANEEIPF